MVCRPSPLGPDRVAHAAHRVQQLQLARGLDLSPNEPYKRIQRIARYSFLRAPDSFANRLPRYDILRPVYQKLDD